MQLITGDCRSVLAALPKQSVHCCVTSPPYFGLRDYGRDGQIGLEQTPEKFVAELVTVFRKVRRVLRDDGTLWLNLGDSYGTAQVKNMLGSKSPSMFKQLLGIPWRVAFALQSDGWYLRQDIIWHKPNPMPESVRDRCTKAHEYIFLLSKSPRYYFDSDAIKEPADPKNHRESAGIRRTAPGTTPHGGPSTGKRTYTTRNRRDVWSVSVRPFKGAHFATFPPDLIEPCVLAGCPDGGTVLDPFNGAGTTGIVALSNRRDYIGIELNPSYTELTRTRFKEAGFDTTC